MNYKKPYSWTEKLDKSKSILICMPLNKIEINAVNIFLDNAQSDINKSIDIVIPKKFVSNFKNFNYYNNIFLYPEVNSNNNIPIKQKTISYIDKKYDIAIDLNMEKNILSNYIAGVKAKKISVGFNNEFSKEFLMTTVIINNQSKYRESIKSIFKLVEINN
ncbi:MAG: hypothetical protein U9N76_01335 [Candidatus Marinimicrobia bacterium]|nr:hypothetical protein [Candidatus Neomarinimicrobiota bacterium]